MDGHTGYVWPVAQPLVDTVAKKTVEYGRAGKEWLDEQIEEHIIEPHLVPLMRELAGDIDDARAVWLQVADACATAETVCRKAGTLGWKSSAAEAYRARVSAHGQDVGGLAALAREVAEAYETYAAEVRSSPVGQALGL